MQGKGARNRSTTDEKFVVETVPDAVIHPPDAQDPLFLSRALVETR
jgi:hypothetical protein